MADTERPSDEPDREAEQAPPAPESPVPPAGPSAAAPVDPAPDAEPPNDEPPSPVEPGPLAGEPSPAEPAPATPSDATPAEIAADLPEPTGEAPTEPPEPVPAEEIPTTTGAPSDAAAPDDAAAGVPAEPDSAPDPSATGVPAEPDAAPDPAAGVPAEPEASGDAAPIAADPRAERADDAPRPDAVPAVPGAHLEPDLVLEGDRTSAPADPYSSYADDQPAEPEAATPVEDAPDGLPVIASTPLELAAGARYQATGKRKTSVARVILKPGTGVYLINGRTLDNFFPRPALLKRARQPLEATGNDARMDVVARIHGGGVSSQAGALRHGVARALVEADPNLRGELKRAGFLTRDARVKERKKAGLKKARKRPQFSKR